MTTDAAQSARCVAKDYLSLAKAQIACSFLTGSALSADYAPASDVDLYVICEVLAAPLKEHVLFHGHRLQITWSSTPTIFAALGAASVSGNPFFPHALAHSEHLAGDPDIHAFLRGHGRRILEAGPNAYRAADVERCRLSLLNYHMKYARLTDAHERLSVGAKLIEAWQRYRQIVAGQWAFAEQYGLRKPHEVEAVRTLQQALVADFHQETSHLSILLQAQLVLLGAEDWTTTQFGPVPFTSL